MKIQILGTGCAKCQKLLDNTKAAVEQLGVECEIEKITELAQITKFGVMMTPALAIDGLVKAAGKVLDPDAIKALIKEQHS
jgi:small redox-active disulfide protein 2